MSIPASADVFSISGANDSSLAIVVSFDADNDDTPDDELKSDGNDGNVVIPASTDDEVSPMPVVSVCVGVVAVEIGDNCADCVEGWGVGIGVDFEVTTGVVGIGVVGAVVVVGGVGIGVFGVTVVDGVGGTGVGIGVGGRGVGSGDGAKVHGELLDLATHTQLV